MTIQTRPIEYTDDTTTLEGFLAWDDSHTSPRPAVAIAHTWCGRDEFVCNKAKSLAELGYVGFAMDLYGKGVRGHSVEENSALMTPFIKNRALLQRRMNLSISAMQKQNEVDPEKTAAMGFCFGGLCVLDLARSGSDVKGVVSFHGLLTPADNLKEQKISARVLVLHGFDDPMAPPQTILDFGREMTQAGADWQLHAYGNTRHAFTNPAANDQKLGTVYNRTADQRSWITMRNFLNELFG